MVLKIEDHDRVRVLTLDRPGAKNAFNGELYDALAAALDAASASDDISVCLLTGSGSAFSAGQDISEFPVDGADIDPNESRFLPFADALHRFDKPIVAAVNGAAIGLGFTLLLHCDLVLISDEAHVRASFVALGIVPELGSTALLPSLVGPQTAAHLLYAGEWMTAQEAVQCGFAWRRYSPEDLLDEALTVASKIASMPLASLTATKRLVLSARDETVTTARRREVSENTRLLRGPAVKAALAALRNSRSSNSR